MKVKLPSETIDYLLMGIVAGIIAGLVLVSAFGVTTSAIGLTIAKIKFAAAYSKL